MSQKADSRVDLRDFPGLELNIDPTDLRPGSAQDQVNMSSAKPAQLEVRPGYREVVFEEETLP